MLTEGFTDALCVKSIFQKRSMYDIACAIVFGP